jgi:hypothetical protein
VAIRYEYADCHDSMLYIICGNLVSNSDVDSHCSLLRCQA